MKYRSGGLGWNKDKNDTKHPGRKRVCVEWLRLKGGIAWQNWKWAAIVFQQKLIRIECRGMFLVLTIIRLRRDPVAEWISLLLFLGPIFCETVGAINWNENKLFGHSTFTFLSQVPLRFHSHVTEPGYQPGHRGPRLCSGGRDCAKLFRGGCTLEPNAAKSQIS